MSFRSLPAFADAPRTPDFLSDTFKEFEERRPQYVFMEKVFLQDQVPASYQEGNARVLAVVDYVKSHYQPFEFGQYLVALKRKMR
jgi:Holliday junction resolvasome RuvABC endonuclease subunit